MQIAKMLEDKYILCICEGNAEVVIYIDFNQISIFNLGGKYSG